MTRTIGYIEYLCSILGAGINDLFSFEKEVLIGKNTFNFVTVLMASQNCSLEFAIYHAIQYLSHCYDEFRSTLLEDFSPARLVQSGLSPREVASLTSLIEDLWLAVKATWVWQAQGTARYQSENWLFTETRPTDDENTMA